MKFTCFTAGNIEFYMPEMKGDEKRLWLLYVQRHKGFTQWKINQIRHSSGHIRSFFFKKSEDKMRIASSYKRIVQFKGKGSKMAIKVMPHRAKECFNILGIESDTRQLFAAKFAADTTQRAELSLEYSVLSKLQDTGIVPKIIKYEQDVETAFLKYQIPEGSSLPNTEMTDDLLDFLITMSQYSLNQYKEENKFGLITCLSNGAFSPWTIIKDRENHFHVLHWQHASDQPLGFDLIYFLMKPFVEYRDVDVQQAVKTAFVWLDKYYSVFGIEDYSFYLDTCSRIYAARLEAEGRYMESNKVRHFNHAALEYFFDKTQQEDRSLLNKSKVLFVMHMPPPIHGASMVGKWIHESEMINSTFDCYYMNLTVANDIADIGKFNLSKFVRIIRTLINVRILAQSIKPELVYITPNAGGGPFIKDSLVVNMLKQMGFPVLAHFHNKGVSKYEQKHLYHKMYQRFFDKLKVLLIVPSLYDDNKTYLRIRDVYFCANGTPMALEKEIPAERHNKVTEILYLSNMIPSKGVLDLLDALYLLRGSKHNFHCTLIGAETPELTKERIQEEIQSRYLTNQVDYIGPRYGKDKDAYFRNADIFVFPTYYPKECFPLVILEAMEYKLPVVSTNEAGIPYAVIHGETGLICKSQNPISLSEQLDKLLKHPELRWKLGEAGYKLRKENFSLDIFEENLTFVLAQAIEDCKTAEYMR